MVRITIWLHLLLLVLMLRHSDAVSEQCSELQNEIFILEGHILKRITELEHRNEILVSQDFVIGLQYSIFIYIAQCYISGYYIFHVSSL